jgi:hypothetical protein
VLELVHICTAKPIFENLEQLYKFTCKQTGLGLVLHSQQTAQERHYTAFPILENWVMGFGN